MHLLSHNEELSPIYAHCTTLMLFHHFHVLVCITMVHLFWKESGRDIILKSMIIEVHYAHSLAFTTKGPLRG